MKGQLIVWCIVLLGCSSTEPASAPIEQGKFIDLLADVRLLEGTYSVMYGEMDRNELASYYVQVFTKYGVTDEEFRESMLHYHTDPDRMVIIEEAVLERLSKMMADERAAEDSLATGDSLVKSPGVIDGRIDRLK